MARRNRYRQMESTMTKVLILDAAIFVLFMFFAGHGWTTAKVIASVLNLLISSLSLAFLYVSKEFFRRRSLWMVTACISILACLIISWILGYPCPPVAAIG